MSKSAEGAKLWMLAKQTTRRFNCGEITLCYTFVGVINVPAILPLNVGEKFVRLADAHDFFEASARSRIAAKSADVRGVVG
jgi:hypothetical protein